MLSLFFIKNILFLKYSIEYFKKRIFFIHYNPIA
uniref:Uncharacterized protein n=1 Tax=Cyanoptyche gloeocystis TaxID=77922 RepID=A0A3G1IWH3_9EUKA|nr:hypothetical protein [Cyanoptyche gloeocystis]